MTSHLIVSLLATGGSHPHDSLETVIDPPLEACNRQITISPPAIQIKYRLPIYLPVKVPIKVTALMTSWNGKPTGDVLTNHQHSGPKALGR